MTLSLLDDPATDGTSGEPGGHGSAGGGVIWTIGREGPRRTPGSECVLLCGNRVTDSISGCRCASGQHALCADCTFQYIDKTLLPRGIVWFDTIKCVGPECTDYMQGMSVQRCISRDLVARIEAAQLELVPTLGPEARRERERAAEAARRERELKAEDIRLAGIRASEEAVTRLGTRPCPNCGIDTEKIGGCSSMVCRRCRHSYRWN